MKKNRILLYLTLLLSFFKLVAQQKQFTVKYINTPITIDAKLDESIWGTAESARDFWQYFPTDSILAKQPTDIKMLYDDKNLYIAIKVSTIGKNYITPTLQRDYRAFGNDNISLVFDTFNDGTNAFLFGITPLGVRREALISGGGSDVRNGFTTSWDVAWKGESKIYDGYYLAEMAIPLTSLKFKEGETKWRFNSYRFDMQSNERSTWIRIPQNQFIFNLAFMGDMIFEKPLGKSRTPIAIIPYTNILSQKDFVENKSTNKIKFGGDAKIAIGNGMNLDLTLNPDFSNVEVDNIIVNITRFEITLPERRQFFIDNNDLFGNFGNSRGANPFFSRRIGIARDINGNSIQNDIVGGLRLSGKLSDDWRLGLLSLQTVEDIENEIPSNNNTVLAIQKKVFNRSNISFLFINRETFKDYDFLIPENRYNRVVGLDYNLASSDNAWVGKFYVHKSFASNAGNEDASSGINLQYNSKKFATGIRSNYIGKDFRSDLGFIRRKDIVSFNPFFEKFIWPNKGKINRHTIRVASNVIWRPSLEFLNSDYRLFAEWQSEFKNLIRISARVFKNYTYLTNPFDPTRTAGAIPLPENIGYQYSGFEVNFQSDRRKKFSYDIRSSAGEFFNGQRYSFVGRMNLRLQPKFFASIDINYDRINLPTPHANADIWLISPRINITFSKKIFWSTLVQYSNQIDNLGFNSRLQWRFAPLSDLFIVYNDNYFVSSFEPRNRSINLKFTYWLNI